MKVDSLYGETKKRFVLLDKRWHERKTNNLPYTYCLYLNVFYGHLV